MTYDTITINTIANENEFILFGYVRRTRNDIFFKTLSRGEYTLDLYIGEKKYVKKFTLYKKYPISEITVDVD